MTPTDKDAMALAAIERAVRYLEPNELIVGTHMATSAAIELREARAHLASRIAELEAHLEASIAMTGENLRRATRAEAELVAVLNFLRDDPLAATFQTLGQYRAAAINAARGGE